MDNWNELKVSCMQCHNCQLCSTRNNVVFGVGAKDADIMFVGEGPGEQEDLQGEPFVGAAGKLLDDMLSIIDINRKTAILPTLSNAGLRKTVTQVKTNRMPASIIYAVKLT